MRRHHPVTGFEIGDALSQSGDDTNQFMPENCALRLRPVVQFEEVRTAKPAPRQLQDDLAGTWAGKGLVFETEVSVRSTGGNPRLKR